MKADAASVDASTNTHTRSADKTTHPICITTDYRAHIPTYIVLLAHKLHLCGFTQMFACVHACLCGGFVPKRMLCCNNNLD